MIGFFEQFNREFVGTHLDPDHAVAGEMMAEKYGMRYDEGDGQIEIRFLSRPVPEKARGKRPLQLRRKDAERAARTGTDRRYNASMCIRFVPGTEDMISSFYMKHWVETEKGREEADILMTDEEFLRGIAVLQEYLDRTALSGDAAECRWLETA